MRLLTKVSFTVAGVVFVMSATASADETALYFATGASSVKSQSVGKIVTHAGGGATWHLTGSTDPRGSDDLNRSLRASRAESVKSALVAAGVDEANITVEEGSASTDADPKSYWKLRRVSIRYEGGHGPAVAKTNPTQGTEGTEGKTDKVSAAEQKKAKAAEAVEARRAAAEQRKTEADQRRADAAAKKAEEEAKRANASQAKKAEAEAKRAEAEQKRADAAAKKKADADAKRAEADTKKAEADARAAAKTKTDGETKVAMNTTKTTEPDKHNTVGGMEKKQLEPLKLIYWKALNHGLWIIAKEKGFFEAEGFDVDLKETDEDARAISRHMQRDVAGGAQSDKALLAGQHKYSGAAVCGFATHEAMAKGDPIVDIGSMIMMPESLLMKKELADELDKSILAFRGKKIGDLSPGNGEHAFKYGNVLRTYLEHAGMKDRQDFAVIEYSDSGKAINDLLSNKLDVAKVFPPLDIEFLRTHNDYVRVPFAKFFPYLPCCRQVVTRSQLKDNRGKYVRMLRASIRAHQFTVNHPREAAEILGRWLGMPASIVRQSIMSAYVNLTPDPMRKGVEMYQRTNDKFTGTKTATAEFVDTSLYRDALLSLQKEDDSPASQGYYNTMVSRFKQNN